MNLMGDVLAKLKDSSASPKKGSGRFRQAAEAAMRAARAEDVDGFEKALDAAVRIKLAERGSDE